MSLWCITPWNTYWSTGGTLGIPEALLLVLLSWLRSVEGEVLRGGGTRVWEGHVVARRVWGTSGTRIYHMGHP